MVTTPSDQDLPAGMLDAVPLLLATCDRDWRYLRVNKLYAGRFGLAPADLVGRSMRDVIGADAVDRVAPHVERVLRGETVAFEVTVDYPSLGRQTLRSTLTPMRDGDGAVVGWHGAAEDITESRRTEEQLRRFAFVLQRTNDFVGISDLQFRPLFLNEAGAALVGITPADPGPAGLTVFDFIEPEHHAFLTTEFFPRVLREGHATVELQFRHFVTGQPIWMAYNVVRMDDEEGRPVGYATVSRNLAEAKRTEARLLDAARERELLLQRLRELADSMPQIVWALTADGVHDYFNQRWYDLMQAPAGSKVDAWNPLHPEDRERCAVEWQAAFTGGLQYEQQYRLKFPGEANYRWYLGRTVPVRDAGGRIVRWYGTSTDIHDQKLAEEALAQSRERLRAALDASETGTFTWHIDTNDLEWDVNLKRLFGVPADAEVTALDDFLHLVHPDDRERVVAACARCARENADFQEEFRVARPDGDVRWLFDKGRVYHSPDRGRYMTGACTDVTARREREQVLRDADLQKDEFLGMVSHELRNPLAPLVFALALIARKANDPGLAGPIGVMQRQVARIRDLVDDLLDLSRIRLGKIELGRQRLDFREVVAESLDSARPSLDARRHHLTLELPEQAVHVLGDRRRLGQVVDNLLMNAVKYTPDSGDLHVSLRTDHTSAVFTVRDTGVGIAADMLSRVFEPFAQEASAAARSEGGLGLGLALVERLVTMHGGSVQAASEGPNRGAEFTVRLPLEGSSR